MKKISIIGSGGAGKSTFAKRLSKAINVPVYHLDALYWKPGWIKTERENWIKIQESIFEKSSWIIDGNYESTLEIRFNASDTIFFLDTNCLKCLYRIIKRYFQSHGRSRVDMAHGCYEQLDLNFMKWVLDFHRSKKNEIIAQLNSLGPAKSVYILKSKQEIDAFIKEHKFPHSQN